MTFGISCRGSAMSATEFQLYAMLSLIFQVSVQACNTGWFGPGCRYKCHCAGLVSCSNAGTCEARCDATYFGPGCQYVDVVQTDAVSTVPSYLTDNNDATCNPRPSATDVQIILKMGIMSTWFRIVVNNGENKMKFFTSLNGQRCKYERKFIVTQNIVDVTCSNPINLTKFEIKGAVSPSVCTIYISKGRNLALKETTKQISDSKPAYSSGKAVDGNRDSDMTHGSCTETNFSSYYSPWWRLTFTQPVILNFIEVFNRNDEYKFRLEGFLLTLYNTYGQAERISKGNGIRMSYKFSIPSAVPISAIRIEQAYPPISLQHLVLNLCEVETYGDYSCKRNTYGLFCESTCFCGTDEVCNSVTGACSTVCSQGFYGKDCLSDCSPNCLLGKCEYLSGKCSPCAPGYTKDTCKSECPPGFFGNSCMSRCSVGCNDACNHVTGYCSCKSLFIGLTCTECQPGTYGPECNSTCSVGCANTSACNSVTGSCVCKKDYIGLTCAGCRPGAFGTGCRFKCSIGCDDICNDVTGHCSCKTDYIGLTCSDLICPAGYNCTERCACKENEVCEIISGTCTGQCVPGYFGSTCTFMCSESCNYKGCHQINGKCIQCSPGYMGDFCDKECLSGTFGLQCDHNCSKHCADVCNITTGQCSCKAGYAGAQCTECREAKYGDNCTLLCSHLCYSNICNADTGECAACIGKRIGRMCEDCPDTYYGPMCENKCSETCVNGACDSVTGYCLACFAVHSGLYCSEEDVSSTQFSKTAYLWTIHIIVIIGLLVMGIASIWMCFVPRTIREYIDDHHTITNKDSAVQGEDITVVDEDIAYITA